MPRWVVVRRAVRTSSPVHILGGDTHGPHADRALAPAISNYIRRWADADTTLNGGGVTKCRGYLLAPGIRVWAYEVMPAQKGTFFAGEGKKKNDKTRYSRSPGDLRVR